MASSRHTKLRTQYLWRVGSGQRMFSSKMSLVDSDTPKVMKFPFPFMTGALFPSLGPAISRTHMLSLCKLRPSMKSQLYSLSFFFFFLMTIVVNSLGPFLYLCIILFVPEVTVIPECPCGFSVGLVPWFSVTSHLSSLPDVFL